MSTAVSGTRARLAGAVVGVGGRRDRMTWWSPDPTPVLATPALGEPARTGRVAFTILSQSDLAPDLVE